ncbi:MAG TPA: FG-GAP-like repeat-containing protein [Solirubrobacteraceae bacterium]
MASSRGRVCADWRTARGVFAVCLVIAAMLAWGSIADAAPFSATAATIPLPSGAQTPSALAVADVNGDGFPDLVTGSSNSSGGTNLSLLLGGAGGAFTQAADTVLTSPDAIQGAAGADLNGDGIPDYAVVGITNELELIFPTSGDASDPGGDANLAETLLDTSSLGTNGVDCERPSAVAVGDLNGDGLPDLAIACTNSGTVDLLEPTTAGDYSGDATGATAVELTAGSGTSAVEIADLNGDGRPDLVVTDKTGSPNLEVFLKDGADAGYTETTHPLPAPSGPVSVAVGDLNGDHMPDIAVANSVNSTKGLGNSVALYVASAPGVYPSAPTTVLHAGNTPSAVVIGDFDGDGRADVAVANKLTTAGSTDDGSVMVFVRDAAGGTYTPTTIPYEIASSGPALLAAGDFNGDGRLDLATGDFFASAVTVLENTTPLSSTVNLAATPTSSTFGQSVTFTATVSGADGGPAPTGSVTFTVDGAALPAVDLSGATAALTTTSLSAGTHTVTAAYSGDSNYTASTSPVTTYAVAAVAPAATTGVASGVTESAASLAGTVGPNGSPTAYTFEYGTSTSFGSLTPGDSVAGSSAVPVSAALTGLAGDTTYYYRLVATNSAGTTFGAVGSFSTGGTPIAPTAVTLAPTASGDTTATLAGSVDPDGQATAFTFEYGTSTSFGSISTVTELDSAFSVEPVSASLTGLAQNTTYFYRVVASNSTGTSTGVVMSFSTGPVDAPVVSTGAATAVAAPGATLSGTVNPDGQQTAFVFEYGRGNNFGSLSAIDNAGSGQGAESVSLPISGLQPHTTYVYRLVATNATGTATGITQTFTTP